jgi:hypothetical protein
MNSTTESTTDVFSRPADDNFNSMQQLLEVAEKEMNESRTIRAKGSDITFSADEGGIFINLTGHAPLPLTNYSLGQIASMAKIPTPMLERLHNKDRDDLIVQNLDTLFHNSHSETKFVLVRDDFSDPYDITSTARAVNGGAYSRLWDFEVFSEIEDFLIEQDFTPSLPPMHFSAMRNSLMHGLDTGLFRGDQCSFGFFFAKNNLPGDTALLGGLKPGMMVWNSEVGARSFGFHTFYYHEASGSIIIWTPANHKRKRFVHRGDITKAFKEYVHTLDDVATNFESRYISDINTFELAAATSFAASPDEAAERLNKEYKMSANNAKAVVVAASHSQNSYGLHLSVWNIALAIAWEAGITGRAESLVDSTLVATKLLRSTMGI